MTCTEATRFKACPGMTAWLLERQVSLLVTGYASARLFLVGSQQGRLSFQERDFVPCMGVAAHRGLIYLGTRTSLWSFDPKPGYLKPVRCWVTDNVRIHDVGVDRVGTPLLVNTLHNCLVTPRSRGIGFEVVWKPDFISSTEQGDRCHLNGLAMHAGRACFVTLVARSDEVDGWRQSKVGGGCVVEVSSQRVVLDGLTMPHSPRLYRDRLWVHDSGSGWLGWVDQTRGRFVRHAFVPGFPRGLCFCGDYALVGVSTIRYFGQTEFPIEAELTSRELDDFCGVCVICLETGATVGTLSFEGLAEVYDLEVIPAPHLELRWT
ncbi:MAG: TIGR03032 family protein [Vulcanimicrobiota bacterium]